MDNVLDIKNLVVHVSNKTILHHITFSVQRGSFLGIAGPNGAGKSTLIKALSRLCAFGGTIHLNGENILNYSRKSLARMVGILPAELHIPFDFSVKDIVLMGRTPYTGFYSKFTLLDEEIVQDALQATDTQLFADRMIHSLSSGEKQRVLIAQALAQKPELLLLDEPTAHLDFNHRKKILDLLWDLNKTHGITIIMVSHDINYVSEYCSRLILLKDGIILADGTSHDIIKTENFHELYGIQTYIAPNPATGNPHIYIVPEYIHRHGNEN